MNNDWIIKSRFGTGYLDLNVESSYKDGSFYFLDNRQYSYVWRYHEYYATPFTQKQAEFIAQKVEGQAICKPG